MDESPTNNTRNVNRFRVFSQRDDEQNFERDHLSQRVASMPPNDLIQIMRTIRMTSEKGLSEMEIRSNKALEEMKTHMNELIQKSEDRLIQKLNAEQERLHAFGNKISQVSPSSRVRHTNASNEPIEGIDVICNEQQILSAISTWFCKRIASDLMLYWSDSNIMHHNSALCIILFGIKRKEGLAPYKTSLGKDMGIQAREIVSRILWNARCAAQLKLKLNGRVPKWIFALVPVCRMTILGSNTLPTSRLLERNSPTSRDSSLSQQVSNSSETLQTALITDYKDLANASSAWEREGSYFKEAVWKGCETSEKKISKERSKKIGRGFHVDAASQQTFHRCLREAQEQIAAGANAVRKNYSNILSQNRCNARESFFDGIGFLLHKIKRIGIEDAKGAGFSVTIPDMTNEELAVFANLERFNSIVGGTRIPRGATANEEEINSTNSNLLAEVTLSFPNLIARCEYPLTVEQKEAEEYLDLPSSSNVSPLPKTLVRKEEVRLISLSLVVLTEFTRAGSPKEFLSSSSRSLQAVVSIAMAFRALILQTLNQSLSSFEQFILGNVFFNVEEIPLGREESSKVMSFIQEESNNTRMNNKLKITRKQFLIEMAAQPEIIPNAVSELDIDADDLFTAPLPIT